MLEVVPLSPRPGTILISLKELGACDGDGASAISPRTHTA